MVTGSDEGSGEKAARSAGSDRRELCAGATRLGGDGFHAGIVPLARTGQGHKTDKEDCQRKKSLCTFAVAVGAVLAFLAPATTPGTLAATPESSPPGIEVKIDNFSYSPAAVTVKAGTQITWTNHDDIPHTVVSSDNVFKSKTLDTDEKFSFIPTQPGTYSYFCSIHPKMTAHIVVQ